MTNPDWTWTSPAPDSFDDLNGMLNPKMKALENKLSGVQGDLGIFNVKEHGLIGDGVTDEATAANAVLAISGAKTVFFPDGIYLTTAVLKIPSNTKVLLARNAIMKRNFLDRTVAGGTFTNSDPSGGNVNIHIEGGQFDVESSTDTDGGHITFQNVARVVIKDIHTTDFINYWNIVLFDCTDVLISDVFATVTSGTGNQDGIHIEGGSRMAIENCILTTGDDSIVLAQQLQTPQAKTDMSDIAISNCILKSTVANGIRLEVSTGQTPSTRTLRRVRISNCTIIGGAQANSGTSSYGGIQIADSTNGGNLTDVVVENVHVDASASLAEAVNIQWGQRITLSNVTVKDPKGPGFRINGATDIRMIECESTGTRGTTQNAVEVADTSAVTHMRIIGGHFDGATGDGISLGSGANIFNVQVLGVLVQNSTLDGIDIDNAVITTGGAIISGCFCELNGGYGVRVGSNSTAVQILGNGLQANTTGAIIDGGAATQAAHNRFSQNGVMRGTAVLVAGTVTVSTAEISAASDVMLTRALVGGTLGHLSIGTVVGGTSFIINSSNGADTSTIKWEISH